MSAAGTTPAKPTTTLARAAQANDVKTWIVNEIETLETEFQELEASMSTVWPGKAVIVLVIIMFVTGFVLGTFI